MHKKNFVAAIKVDGKVLRESSERVELPFGSEYSVLLKNLDTVRMQAQMSIDGQDATGWLVVDPGASVDIERFYRQNRDRGNRFKFIERTERIEEHRGVGAEDGLIRIEFKREKVYEYPKIVWPYRYTTPHWNFCGTLNQNQNVFHDGHVTTSSSLRSRGLTATASYSGPIAAMNMQSQQSQQTAVQNEAGITVDGSISSQRFISVAGFECEAPEVIVLHLVGRKGTADIPVARTVDYRPTCETCGKKNKATSKFCVECGTSLERV